MTARAADQDLHELRPARGVLLRHRGATLEVHQAPRAAPRVELRDGALWVRAAEGGVGVTVVHGASSIHLASGAIVVEVHEVEALVLVASGQAAIRGSGPLPRSVDAGQAVALTIDGTTSEPDRLGARELADDRMVVENLARDLLAARLHDVPAAVDEVARTGPLTPSGPRLEPKPELVLRSGVVNVDPEPSALETALANVGVTSGPPAGPSSEAGDPLGAIIGGPHGRQGDLDPSGGPAPDEADAVPDIVPGPEAEAQRRRKILALVVAAMILFAIVVAVVLSSA